ncbi:hypothetical protein HDU91_005925, partial [Kappamyces sp. JEL0680]
FVDGYPDYVSSGGSNGGAPAAIVGIIAFVAGPSGFTRGIVGAYGALYSQTRFWASQFWDVQSAPVVGEGSLYKRLNGTKLSSGFYQYGSTLNAKIGVFPAWATVTPLDCTLDKYKNDACCTSYKNSAACTTDRLKYREQAKFFANSTCVTPGEFQVAPDDSEHGYLYHADYYTWLTNQLLTVLS